MLQSQLFYKTQKTLPKEEISKNAQLLLRAGYVDKLMAGVYNLLPLGKKVTDKIENVIREEMNAIGGQELFLPTLHPKNIMELTGRWNEIDVLFKLESNKREYSLGSTHEEGISPLAKKMITSRRDLPKYVYQIQNKFRNELRAKSGVLRTREFLMKDLYSFHENEEDLDEYYERVKKAYVKIFQRCGIGDVTYLTYASGGTFSKYSHEFQTLTDAGEDNIYICDKCRIAINEEIIEDQNHMCPECGNKKLRTEKAVEVGNIFKLMDKFSTPFDLTYKNEKGENRNIIMGCYGIGIQRLMGTIVEVTGNESGLIWPEKIAPFKVHLLSFGQNEKALKIYEVLQKKGIEVLYDDRDAGPGEKLAESDLMGFPYRVIVSAKTVKDGKISLKLRNEADEKLISEEELISLLIK